MLEWFMAWYSGERSEIYQAWIARPTGPGAIAFWLAMICNVLVPQILWWGRARRNLYLLFALSLLVNVGMWAERFMIIVQSLVRVYLPSQWASYSPTWVDLGILFGTFGFFSFLYLLFIRFFPFIPASEIKEELSEHEGEVR
jgi:molybdopterin-containing oxidoreductase family membrane subunit